MGSSTAWHLSNYGEQVLLLEQQDSIYSYGSSQGEARIARSLGPVGDKWSYMHNRSVNETEKLIDYLNQNESSHSMEEIYTTSPVSYVRHIKQVSRIEKIIENQTDSYEYASNPNEAKELFGAQMADSTIFLREYKKHSGVVNPQALIKHLHKAVRQKGNSIWYNHQVTNLKKNEDGFEIQMTDLKTGSIKTILSKRVVAAAGPYTGQLLNDVAPYFDQLISPERVFLSFFKINGDIYNSLPEENKQQLGKSYPVINSSKGTRDGSFFSMIEKIDTDGIPIIKIGGHFQRSAIDNLDQVWQKSLSATEIDWSKQGTLGYLSLINLPVKDNELEFSHGYSCVYSLTNNEVPYVTNAILEGDQKDPNLIVLGGMSGVGAKGAMTYGLIGANLLLDKTENGEMYNTVVDELGFQRLMNDLKR